jgi:SSS family transporter
MDLSSYEHTNLVIVGILVFFAIRVAIGYWASRHVSSAADYIVAGRGLPIYMAAASIMATWFAGETLLGASANAYRYGFQGVVFDPFGAVLCLVVSGLFFIRLMRRARYLTVVDFFEKRYGPQMSLLGSLVQLLTYFIWTAAQIVAGGSILHTLLGWPVEAGMVTVGLIVTVYTTMGGMLADTLLDFIQMFFTAGGITAVFLYVLKAVGGWEGMTAGARSLHFEEAFALWPVSGEQGFLGYTGHLGLFYWIAAWLTVGLGSVATQDLMQRSMSARNGATSVWGSYFAAILYFVFGVMSPLIGIMVFRLNPDLPESAIDGLLVMVAIEYLPTALTVLFIAALTSALMSTSDSSILAGASVVTENIMPFFRSRKLDGRQQLAWTRIMVLINGSVSILIAVVISEMYRLAMIAWAVLLVGMFTPFAFGMYWKKANRSGAIAASLGGFVAWLVAVFYYLPATKEVNTTDGVLSFEDAVWDAVYISSTPALAVSIVLMIVVSLATQRADAPRPLTDVDGNPLPLTKRLGLLSPARIFRDAGEPNPFTKEQPAASDT